MINFDEKSSIFKLDTKNTSYIFGVYKANVLMHLYWGSKLPDVADFDQYVLVQTKALSPQDIGLGGWSTNVARMEYPTHGSVDLRNPAFECTFDDGSACPQLRYVGHRIYDDPMTSDFASLNFVSEDKKRVVLFRHVIATHPSCHFKYTKLNGLEPEAQYVCRENGKTYSGAMLMNVGIAWNHKHDYESEMFVFDKV